MQNCGKVTVNDMKTTEKRGKLIVFEGIDGAGKTTQINLLKEFLAGQGRRVVCTAEPTDLPSGKELRRALAGEKRVTACELAVLFTLDRVAHNTAPDGIEAWLSSGADVICDRYYYSSLAYQGSDIDGEWVARINLDCPEIATPDVCVFLDVSPELAIERISKNRETTEIYEKKEKLADVREKYFKVFEKLKGRDNINVIDASGSPEEVAERIYKTIEN